MDCPGCSGGLKSHRTPLFNCYTCGNCNGILLDSDAMKQLQQHIKKHLTTDQEIIIMLRPSTKEHLVCSGCHYTLYPIEEGEIALYHCLNCGKYWLPEGMLATLIGFLRSGGQFQISREQMSESNPLHHLFSLINKDHD